MNRRIEQIRRHEADYRRIAAEIVTKVDDEGMTVGQDGHRSRHRLAADARRWKGVELHVPHVAKQHRGIREGATLVPPEGSEEKLLRFRHRLRLNRNGWGTRGQLVR